MILLGASGSIGSVLFEELTNFGISVTPISDYNQNFLSYDDFFSKKIKTDLIVDCSKKNLNFYLKLYELYGWCPIIHFSTQRLRIDTKFDQYDYYKLDVLKIINSFDNKTIIYGDLFKKDDKYLGYWSRLNKSSTLVSYRTINETEIKKVISLVTEKSTEYLYTPSKLKHYYVNKTVFNLLGKLRLQRAFQIFNYHLVK